MGGSPEWDNRMMDSLKNFDISSPEVKEQFGNFSLKKNCWFQFSLSTLKYQESNNTKVTLIVIE